MAYEELKQRQSVMWGTGPYQRITETIADIHERVDRAARSRTRACAGSTWRAAPAPSPSARRRAARPSPASTSRRR